MKKYVELVVIRDELVEELLTILSSIHSRVERKSTSALRQLLESNKMKSQDIREVIGVLKYNNCPPRIIDLAEELCAQQTLIEDQYYISMKSETILKELEALRSLPERDGRLVDFERAVYIVANAGKSPDEYIETLTRSDAVAGEVSKLLSLMMSVRSSFDGLTSCRQLTLDSLIAG